MVFVGILTEIFIDMQYSALALYWNSFLFSVHYENNAEAAWPFYCDQAAS
jgi:hypothetical protein